MHATKKPHHFSMFLVLMCVGNSVSLILNWSYDTLNNEKKKIYLWLKLYALVVQMKYIVIAAVLICKALLNAGCFSSLNKLYSCIQCGYTVFCQNRTTVAEQ